MLLQRIAGGDPDASAALLQLLYDDLRRLAEAQMRGERAAHTLQATALVHEAWVRMVGPANEPASGWEGRAHFVGAFAEAMRRVLVDHARRRGRIKRGGGCRRVPLGALDLIGDPDPELIGALDDAISRLEAHDRELSQVVRL
ncbi:MAG: RNA polymerase subunit sigma, partial [Planctomycetes bacterium]|nr:RNA polymerase subunit sigma [Planctomycetota bacterium]